MQREAPEAFDLARESAATQQLYGIDDPATDMFGRQCLMARRLVERGVRFVQLFDAPDEQRLGPPQRPAREPAASAAPRSISRSPPCCTT